mgnify:CR=1 FL=1
MWMWVADVLTQFHEKVTQGAKRSAVTYIGPHEAFTTETLQVCAT